MEEAWGLCMHGVKSLSLTLLTPLVRSDRFEGKLGGSKLNYTLSGLFGFYGFFGFSCFFCLKRAALMRK
jgi:hypothetical protein